jgi:hypothetical protein
MSSTQSAENSNSERSLKPAVMLRSWRSVAPEVGGAIDEAYFGRSCDKVSCRSSFPSPTAMPTRVESTLLVTEQVSNVSSGEAL